MKDLKKAKFVVQVVLTFMMVTFGTAVFFVSTDKSTSYFGATVATNAWMLWMSGSRTKRPQPDVENPN